MPFPTHPAKLHSEPIVTPEKNNEYRETRGVDVVEEPPRGVVLCYSRSLMEYFSGTYDGRAVGSYYGDLYVFDDMDDTVGVMGNFGIGAPTTAMLMEELVADGVEAFLSIGIAGCLDDTIEMGEFVVPDRAIRDEGTSYHYLESETYAYPSESLTAETTQFLDERGKSFHVGPTWTIDAIYRETRAEVERYADEGVLTVEMEASAVFAVASHLGVEAGAMFVISDYLGLADWEPKFHLEKGLHELGDSAKEILANYVN